MTLEISPIVQQEGSALPVTSSFYCILVKNELVSLNQASLFIFPSKSSSAYEHQLSHVSNLQVKEQLIRLLLSSASEG